MTFKQWFNENIGTQFSSAGIPAQASDMNTKAQGVVTNFASQEKNVDDVNRIMRADGPSAVNKEISNVIPNALEPYSTPPVPAVALQKAFGRSYHPQLFPQGFMKKLMSKKMGKK